MADAQAIEGFFNDEIRLTTANAYAIRFVSNKKWERIPDDPFEALSNFARRGDIFVPYQKFDSAVCQIRLDQETVRLDEGVPVFYSSRHLWKGLELTYSNQHTFGDTAAEALQFRSNRPRTIRYHTKKIGLSIPGRIQRQQTKH